jgi:hypothetical protein
MVLPVWIYFVFSVLFIIAIDKLNTVIDNILNKKEDR